jgi:hypothetical protein
MNTTEFDEIRPYYDEELSQVYEELINDPAFQQAACMVMPDVPFPILAEKMRACKTKLDFQKTFCYEILHKIGRHYTQGMTLDFPPTLDKKCPYTYLSNHRDIILDAGFLSILLVDCGMDTVEIAIGDNLLIYPWIKTLVRINKSFIVQRALTMRQMLESSTRMSRYMHYTIQQKRQSIWISQREGRAKDSNDRTQESVVKMLAMGGEGTLTQRLKELNIAPLSISYEYDPCDFLKAREFQLRRDDEEYKKSTQDDLKNMETGLFGYKGRVHFQLSVCINEELDKLDKGLSKAGFSTAVSELIDRLIHSNYRIYPGNYVAYDLLYHTTQFAANYTAEERQTFDKYIEKQLQRIDIPGKDIPFLTEKLLEMYANPLINYLEARS